MKYLNWILLLFFCWFTTALPQSYHKREALLTDTFLYHNSGCDGAKTCDFDILSNSAQEELQTNCIVKCLYLPVMLRISQDPISLQSGSGVTYIWSTIQKGTRSEDQRMVLLLGASHNTD